MIQISDSFKTKRILGPSIAHLSMCSFGPEVEEIFFKKFLFLALEAILFGAAQWSVQFW